MHIETFAGALLAGPMHQQHKCRHSALQGERLRLQEEISAIAGIPDKKDTTVGSDRRRAKKGWERMRNEGPKPDKRMRQAYIPGASVGALLAV